MEYGTNQPFGQIIAAHDSRLRLWAAETTALAAGTYAGEFVPAQTSPLVWRPSGTPEVGRDLELRVQQSGYPGGRGTYAWRRSGETPWLGWDAPTSVTSWEAAVWSSTASEYESPQAAVTALDEVVLVTETRATSTGRTIRVAVRSAAGVWSSPDVLTSTTVSGSGIRLSPTVYRLPAASADGNGRMRIVHWWHDAQEKAQVWTWEADETDDLGDPSSWTLVALSCLDVPIDASSGKSLTTLRACAGGGQVLLLAHVVDGGTLSVIQYASSDEGISFTRVEELTGMWGASITRGTGVFVVGYVETGAIRARSTGDAFAPLSLTTEQTVYTMTTTALGYDVTTAVAADPSGAVWLYANADDSADIVAMAWESTDGGQTWGGIAGTSAPGATWATGRALQLPGAMWWRDRVLMVHHTDGATGYDESVVVAHLGGWTTATLPERGYTQALPERVSWTRSWSPDTGPDQVFTVVDTGGGTVTVAWRSDATVRVTTDASVERSYRDSSTAQTEPVGAEVALDVDSGTVVIACEAMTATAMVRARVEVTATGLTLIDTVSSATIGTATISGAIEVRLWASGRTSRVLALYRARGSDPGARRVWTELGSGALSTTAGTYGRASVTVMASSVVDLRGIRTLTRRDSEPYLATAGIDPTMNGLNAETQLRGRPMSSRPFWLDDGVSVAAQGGSGRAGDQWSSSPAASYGLARIAATSTYPRPVDTWRSTDETSQAVAWLFTSAGEVASTLSPVWAVWVRGPVQVVTLSWHDGTSWSSGVNLPLYEDVVATRQGDTLVPTGTVASSRNPHVEMDELAGGYVVIGSTARRIRSNEPGLLKAYTGSTAPLCRIVLDGVTGSESSSSTTWRVVWPELAATIRPPSTAKGVRLRFGAVAGATVTRDGWHEAKVLLGPAYPLGQPHEMETVTTLEVPAERTDGRSGGTWSTQPAPARRVVEITWQRGVELMHQIRMPLTAAANPDHFPAWIGGAAAWSRGEGAGTLGGMVRRWAGAGVPVLYMPSYQRSTEPSVYGGEVHPDQRARGALLATLDPTYRVEQIGGEEQLSEQLRLGALLLREVV